VTQTGCRGSSGHRQWDRPVRPIRRALGVAFLGDCPSGPPWSQWRGCQTQCLAKSAVSYVTGLSSTSR
jgi:hypothetical protein